MAGILRRPGSLRPIKKPRGGMVRWAEKSRQEEKQRQLVESIKKKRVRRRKPMIGLKEPNVGSAVDRTYGKLKQFLQRRI